MPTEQMSEAIKARLAKIPQSRCFVCNSPKSYTNPVEKCFECKRKFCYDHLWGGQVNAEMTPNQQVRQVCDECRKKHNYNTL